MHGRKWRTTHANYAIMPVHTHGPAAPLTRQRADISAADIAQPSPPYARAPTACMCAAQMLTMHALRDISYRRSGAGLVRA